MSVVFSKLEQGSVHMLPAGPLPSHLDFLKSFNCFFVFVFGTNVQTIEIWSSFLMKDV